MWRPIKGYEGRYEISEDGQELFGEDAVTKKDK
nr:MAG TPA: NUMOD4 motif protein [Caudoviricetes sp.]